MSTKLTIVDSPDCGNAPRKAIVRDIAVALARGDTDALRSLVRDDAVWSVVGDLDLTGTQEIAEWVSSLPAASELRFGSVLTHGREASVSGTTTLPSGAETYFSHVIKFASAGKAAKVISVASYLITPPEPD